MKISAFLLRLAPRWLVLSAALAGLAATASAGSYPARFQIRPAEAFDDPKQIALAAAAQAGDVAAVEKALKGGAKVNAVGPKRMTALAFALFAEKKPAFIRLLELGADPNVIALFEEPLIGACIRSADTDYLKLALAHGGDPDAAKLAARTPPLHRAVYHGSIAALDLLLKAGADINIRNQGGETAANIASAVSDAETLLFLLERGADPRLRDGGESDIVEGLFRDNDNLRPDLPFDPTRQKIIELLKSQGIQFDWDVIARYRVRNFGEATGQEVPMWARGKEAAEPNPAWVKAYPKKAEQWYQDHLNRPAPKL